MRFVDSEATGLHLWVAMTRRTRRRLVVLALIGLSAPVGCEGPTAALPPRDSEPADLTGRTLVARLVHVSDSHIVDEQSPARLAHLHELAESVWRPQESYSAQLFDGIVRAVNRIHASGRTINFLIHTGDACDNVQTNELGWFLCVLDGQVIDPLSGPDDRPIGSRPQPTLDPHAPFAAQGLYRKGVHGDLPSIPWYVVLGNHDVYATGALPIFEDSTGHRTAPLPFDQRPGLWLPTVLDPVGSLGYAVVTPAEPGPPCLLQPPSYVAPNPQRAFFAKPEFVRAMFSTVTEPAGHGFGSSEAASTWYSARPVPGVRLIGLDTTDAATKAPAGIYVKGAISRGQLQFLREELRAAETAGELVIVATHHPSEVLTVASGTQVLPAEFRSLLRGCPQVVLHLCGHSHRNQVTDRGGYLEVETCSTLDAPQEARLIEIWRQPATGQTVVTYQMFSHLDDSLPPLGPDPLRRLREEAAAIAPP